MRNVPSPAEWPVATVSPSNVVTVMSASIGLSGHGLPATCTGHMGPSRTLPWIPAVSEPEVPTVEGFAHAETEKARPTKSRKIRFTSAG